MSVPLIGESQSGICLLCKGILTADHQHVYVDTKFLDYMDGIIAKMVINRCILAMEDGQLIEGHPRLKKEYTWYPVKVTHEGPHDKCTARMPHHHCEVNDDEPRKPDA